MSHVKTYVLKMRGGGDLPAAPKLPAAVLSSLGACLAIVVVGGMTAVSPASFIMAPLGASCFLAFAVPSSPLAQPRNIVFGHLLSTATGLLVLQVCGPETWAMGLAVGLAVLVMLMTRTGHPPAGADPLVVIFLQPGWDFLVFPALAGAIMIAAVAVAFNNLRPSIRYPLYW